MVLDDGLIAGLDPARTRAVLAPKVDGAANLDRATRRASLDYFLVFSSATTMVGNPGQAAYVAANGYLQGLMRRRLAEGLPGLAIGWGAIADAGVLARERDVAAKLERISGIVAMPAQEALSCLDTLLTLGPSCPATVFCAMFRPGAALQGLKLLRTPAFAQLLPSPTGCWPGGRYRPRGTDRGQERGRGAGDGRRSWRTKWRASSAFRRGDRCCTAAR